MILLVPHKWHLEEKQVVPIQPLPYPIAQHPPEGHHDSIIPTYDRNIHISLEDIQTLAHSIPNDTTHLTMIVSNPDIIHQLLNTLPSRPTLIPIISSLAGSTCFCFPQSLLSTHLIGWMSRSTWCPPPLDNYSLIAVTSRYISIPLILPLQSDSLLFTATSAEESLSLVRLTRFFDH